MLAALNFLILNRDILDLKFSRTMSLEVFNFLKPDSLTNCVLACAKRVITLDNKGIRLSLVFHKGGKLIEFSAKGV